MINTMEEEYNKLLRQQTYAEQAKFAEEFLNKFCDNTIDECLKKFEKISEKNYQPLDNNVIFVLQLQIAMAKEIKSAIAKAKIQGEIADERLNAMTNGGR